MKTRVSHCTSYNIPLPAPVRSTQYLWWLPLPSVPRMRLVPAAFSPGLRVTAPFNLSIAPDTLSFKLGRRLWWCTGAAVVVWPVLRVGLRCDRVFLVVVVVVVVVVVFLRPRRRAMRLGLEVVLRVTGMMMFFSDLGDGSRGRSYQYALLRLRGASEKIKRAAGLLVCGIG